jgi:hypothetical protein
VPRVVGDQRASQSHGVRCDQGVELAYRRSPLRQQASDAPELGGGLVVEGRHLDLRDEGIDQAVQLA